MPYKDAEKQKSSQRQFYLRQKDIVYQRVVANRLRNKEFVQEYKLGKSCVNCKENDPCCLDFHHVDSTQKDETIAQGTRDWGLGRLKSEINKCIIVCSNCHRKLHKSNEQHTTTNKKRIENRNFVIEYKLSHPCSCGESDVCCLDFHHLGDKEICISKAARHWGIKRIKKEIDKCVILCANCHRKLHFGKITLEEIT